MANDIVPCRSTIDLTNEKFATNSNGKTVVRVEDEEAVGLLQLILNQLGGTAGAPFFESVQAVTDPGVEQTLLSVTVGVGDTLNLRSVRISCRRNVSYTIEVDSTVVGSGRVGAGNLNDKFIFDIDNLVASGSTIEVKALANSNNPASDIECYLQGLII